MKQHTRRLFQSGFTLLETLAVLTIMGVILSLIVVNFGKDEKQQLQQESHRLALLMSHASATARSTGQPLAWSFKQGGYQFLQRTTNRIGWQIIASDQTLRQRQLPPGIQILDQRIEGVRLAANEMIIFSPSGINAPFSLTLASKYASTKLTGNLLGNISEEPVIEKRSENIKHH